MEVYPKLLAEVIELEEAVLGKVTQTQLEQYLVDVVNLRRKRTEKISKIEIKYVFDGSAKRIEDDQLAMCFEKIEVEEASLQAHIDLANSWLKTLLLLGC